MVFAIADCFSIQVSIPHFISCKHCVVGWYWIYSDKLEIHRLRNQKMRRGRSNSEMMEASPVHLFDLDYTNNQMMAQKGGLGLLIAVDHRKHQ
jgi:hypothetical protein